jgi:hypothetical protein
MNEQLRITPEIIKNAPFIECECGSVLFTERILFKKISALISPTNAEELYPMPVIVCDKCGKAHPKTDPLNMVPDNLKSNVKLT